MFPVNLWLDLQARADSGWILGARLPHKWWHGSSIRRCIITGSLFFGEMSTAMGNHCPDLLIPSRLPDGELPLQSFLLHSFVGTHKNSFQFSRSFQFSKVEKLNYLFILNFLFCTGVWLINNVVIVSCEPRKDSAMHIHVSILPQILFPPRLPHNMEQSLLCCTVGACWLSILNTAVCTCSSQTP